VSGPGPVQFESERDRVFPPGRHRRRIRRTLTWWKDCIEHWGWLGWHRSLWLRDLDAEQAIDQETDALLRYLLRLRGLSVAGRTRVERAESHIRRLRAQR
jgi:hypothetical protein